MDQWSQEKKSFLRAIAPLRETHLQGWATLGNGHGNDDIATAFGRVLREQRETRGISQEDLALSADVDRSFVSQMERGIRQPTLTTLVKLCKALGVAPSTIIGRMERLLD